MAKIIITVETHSVQDSQNVDVLIQGDHPDVHFDMSQVDVMKYILYAVVCGTIKDHPTLSAHAKSIQIVIEPHSR